MKAHRTLIVMCATLMAGFVGVPPGLGAGKEATMCNGTWQFQQLPTNRGFASVFSGISGTGSADVWAVGAFATLHVPLIEHWDGTRWRNVKVPAPSGAESGLGGVLALAPDDAWAVGGYSSAEGSGPLAEHWDGTRWRIIPSPSKGTGAGLMAVSGTSSVDVWAVGTYRDRNNVAQTLIEHWDGSRWRIVASPGSPSGGNVLYDVVAISTEDVWAVGSSIEGALIEHWDGTAWKIVQSPNPGDFNELFGVDAASATDIWAVGYQQVLGSSEQVLTIHWDASSWSVISAQNVPGSTTNNLRSVWAISSSDAWAVGFDVQGSPAAAFTLAEHWDGTSWTIVPTPDLGTLGSRLTGVWAASSTDLFAVGWALKDQSRQRPLAMRNCA